jgi:tetratricopeptide (TPR) repeat protein
VSLFSLTNIRASVLLLCSTLVLFGALPIRAQTCVQQALNEADALFAKLEIKAALGKINNCSDIDPSISDAYIQHGYFIQCFVHQGPDDFIRFNEAARITEASLDPDTPTKQSLLAGSYLERALVHLFQRNYFAATLCLRRSYNLAKTLEGADAPLYGQRVAGIFEMGLSSMPIRYQWILKLLGYSGDLARGKLLLERSGARPTAHPIERELMLFYMEKNVLAQTQHAGARIDSLLAAAPDNPLLLYLWASFQIDLKKATVVSDKLAPLLATTEGQNLGTRMPYLWYVLAKAQLFAQDYPAAIRNFEKFLQTHRGTLLHADAGMRIGLAWQLSGNRNQAMQLYRRTLDMPNSGFDQDARAVREARHQLEHIPTAAENDLIRARYLYDGGFLRKANAVLDSTALTLKQLNPEERTELYYRFGRVQQARGFNSNALTYYQLVLQQHPYLNYWMLPYSHFYIGEIKEAEGKSAEALVQYRTALGYEDYDFRNSLEQKLKAAIKRLTPTQSQ